VLCLALVPLFKLAYGGTLRDWGGQLLCGLKYLLGAKSAQPTESAWKAIGFVNVLLVAALAYVWVDAAGKAGGAHEKDSSVEAQEEKIAVRRAEVLKKYDATKAVPIPVDDDDPRIGPRDAPCQIVVFSTFHCKGCQGVAFALENLRREHPQEVSIVYKYQTYGEEACPRDQVEAEATASCRANWAAEAAHRQGKFWEYHDALFRRGVECQDEDFVAAAKAVGLDLAKFDADRRSPEVRERVAKHLLLGSSLGVVITPDALLNGKRFPEFGHQQFVWVVDHVLDLQDAAETPQTGHSSPAAASSPGR
jgi:protein-disulfide isomerase